MRMTALVSLVVLLMLAACGGDTNGADGSTALPDEVTVPVTETTTSPAVSATDGVVYATSLNADGTAGATWELDIYSPTTDEGGVAGCRATAWFGWQQGDVAVRRSE
ncbi:MAG: hypothetical protein IH818_12660 [Acidobacteria bacterium]|nr:hypothetical protein [Acidobacteriota bacterium]